MNYLILPPQAVDSFARLQTSSPPSKEPLNFPRLAAASRTERRRRTPSQGKDQGKGSGRCSRQRRRLRRPGPLKSQPLIRWPKTCGRLLAAVVVTLVSLSSADAVAAGDARDADVGTAPVARPLLLARSSPTAGPDSLRVALRARTGHDGNTRHVVPRERERGGDAQYPPEEAPRWPAPTPGPPPLSLSPRASPDSSRPEEADENDAWYRDRKAHTTDPVDNLAAHIVGARQATGHYTNLQVLGATATVTLLPVIGLNGQVVAPVVVPVSTTTPGAAPASSSATAAPPAPPAPAPPASSTTVQTTVASVTSVLVQTETSVAVQTSIVVATSVQVVTSTALANGGQPPQASSSGRPQSAAPPSIEMTAAPSALPTSGAGTSGAGISNGQPQGDGSGVTPIMQHDLAAGPFLGGDPNTSVDLPLTIVFLILFAIGAFTHISIYRANARRGHKFLLSDLVFDFCMVRIVTCIFRIVWVFVKLRGIILMGLIFQFAGAAVLFVLGIFFVQRVIRSMHPAFGWTPFYRFFTTAMAFSVPAVIVMNLSSILVIYFSVDNQDRFEAAENVLKAGQVYNMWLVLYPVLALFIASWISGPRIERFGMGPFRIKIAVIVTASFLLSIGAIIRLDSVFNPVPPGTENDSAIFNKATFYTTQFMVEILVVFMFAVARVDLRFHVPDGCVGPGDYSTPLLGEDQRPMLSREQITGAIQDLGVPYEILQAPPGGLVGAHGEPVVAVFYAQSRRDSEMKEKEQTRVTRASGSVAERPATHRQMTQGSSRYPAEELESPPVPMPVRRADSPGSTDDAEGSVASFNFGEWERLQEQALPPRVQPVSRRRSIKEAVRPASRANSRVSRANSQRSRSGTQQQRRASWVLAGSASAPGGTTNGVTSPSETNLTSWIRETANQQEQWSPEGRVPAPPEKSEYAEYISFSDRFGPV